MSKLKQSMLMWIDKRIEKLTNLRNSLEKVDDSNEVDVLKFMDFLQEEGYSCHWSYLIDGVSAYVKENRDAF